MSRIFCAAVLVLGAASLPVPALSKADYEGVTPKNKAEAETLAFLDLTFNQKHFDEAFERYVGPYYRQHNPTVADGKEAILEALRKWMPQTPGLHYAFKHVWSDGDRVIVHSQVSTSPTDRGQAVIDIFRLEKGKIVEHWDVAEAIPEKSLNDNSMF
jgi:predicted SnoaL-like aldol condensation-catalyzing enzyme